MARLMRVRATAGYQKAKRSSDPVHNTVNWAVMVCSLRQPSSCKGPEPYQWPCVLVRLGQHF